MAHDGGPERQGGGVQRGEGVVFLIFWSPGCIAGWRRMERGVGGEACARAEGSLPGPGWRRAGVSLYHAGSLGRCATLGAPGLARYCGGLETRLTCEPPPLSGCCLAAALCSSFSPLLPLKGLQTALARSVMTKATFLVGLTRGFCGLLQGY